MGRALTIDERRQVLDLLINERLAIQEAGREKLSVTDNEVNQAIDQIRQSVAQQAGQNPTDTQFALVIKQQTGMSMPDFREQTRRQLIMQKLLMAKKGDQLKKAVKIPTEKDINDAYRLNRAQFVRPETVRLSMIQIPFGNNKSAAQTLANKLNNEIGGDPAKFDAVVLRAQSDKNVGYTAGDAGYVPLNAQAVQAVGKPTIDEAFSLKQGQVSPVITDTASYRIIKITETYAQQNLGINDIFQLGTRMTVHDYIKNYSMQQEQEAALAKAQQELVAELRKGKPYQIFDRNLNW
jgi:parvulin-like peptidyl-prolyl isomerase